MEVIPMGRVMTGSGAGGSSGEAYLLTFIKKLGDKEKGKFIRLKLDGKIVYREIIENKEERAGKWLLFPLLETALSDWRKICESQSRGVIKYAKTQLSTNRDSVIVVYTPDYLNVKEVREMGLVLCEMGLSAIHNRKHLYYKPDLFTHDKISGSIYRMIPETGSMSNAKGFSRLSEEDQLLIKQFLRI